MEFELLFMPRASEGPDAARLAEDLVRDLRLDVLLDAMSNGDTDMRTACGTVMARPLSDMELIRQRSAVMRDALGQEGAFSELYALAGEALESVRSLREFTSPRYDRVIPNQKKIVTESEIASLNLKSLLAAHAALSSHAAFFSSDALKGLCRAIERFVTGDGFARVEACIRQLNALKTADGLCVGGHIGEGLKQADVVLGALCEPAGHNRRSAADEVIIPLSNVALIQNAEEIVESALSPVHRAIAGFNRSVGHFFEKMRFQTAFFVGCTALRRRLEALGVPLCSPVIASEAGEYAGTSLVDASLALKESHLPAPNDFCFTGRRQIVITGPNQGGKTTFLRSVGLGQIMAQCGMFVAAGAFTCPLFGGVYTHFPGAEDETLRMGLLEMELSKLREITGALQPGGLLMMNESFQSTMPLDAKSLADEIVSGLVDAGVTVLFVTHLYAYAMDLYRKRQKGVLLLRAQRDPGGRNTYEIREGEPFQSAFGMTLFSEVIG